MNSINKTMYIPLYGKALVSKMGIILKDNKAEEIWDKAQFPLKGKSKSKWLAYYMGMRSAVFDNWLSEKLAQRPNAVVLHLGCGLDSRVLRVQNGTTWFDVDFADVIEERKLHYQQTDLYHMVSADITDITFVESLPKSEHAIIVMEGVSMYLTNKQLQQILAKLATHFDTLSLLIDCYTPLAAKMSKIKNPINDVGVTKVYGIANAQVLQEDTGLKFVTEHNITPPQLIKQLSGSEKFVFKTLYAGKMSKRLYKMYEYKLK